MQTEKQNRGKVKNSYVTNKEEHSGNHSWDSDSDAEQEPVSHSRQHLTPREKKSKKLKRHQEQNNLANEGITEEGETGIGLNTCCVPLDNGIQVTG